MKKGVSLPSGDGLDPQNIKDLRSVPESDDPCFLKQSSRPSRSTRYLKAVWPECFGPVL